MSIEKITSAIIDEAQTECEQIMNAARTKGNGTINALKKRIVEETEVAVRDAEEESKRIVSRRKSVADIDSKKIILAKKQELINRCFDEAVEYIVSIEEEKYIKFLTEAGKNSGLSQGALIFNKNERDKIGAQVVDALNKAVPEGKFTLSEETRNLRGGYMLQNGQVYINNSVEAMVDEKRRELTGDVASILFPPEK